MTAKAFFVIVGIALAVIFGCGKDSLNIESVAEPLPRIETIRQNGSVVLQPGGKISPQELEVVTLTDSTDVMNNGAFSLDIPENDNPQIALVNSTITNNSIYIAVYNPIIREIEASAQSTALGLVLLNPNLLGSPEEVRLAYIQAAQQTRRFSELVARIAELHLTDPHNALDYDSYPVVYQLAVQTMQETTEILVQRNALQSPRLFDIEPPFIDDGP